MHHFVLKIEFFPNYLLFSRLIILLNLWKLKIIAGQVKVRSYLYKGPRGWVDPLKYISFFGPSAPLVRKIIFLKKKKLHFFTIVALFKDRKLKNACKGYRFVQYYLK